MEGMCDARAAVLVLNTQPTNTWVLEVVLGGSVLILNRV